MTLEECKNATALLAFTEELSDLDDTAESAFCAALNRAMWSTDGVRPRTATLTLSHLPPFSDAADDDGSSLYVHYDLKRLAPNLAGVLGSPTYLCHGTYLALGEGYLIENRTDLYLPRSATGDYRIRYRVSPQSITTETDSETELALDEDLCQLLPLLAAHYLLLDEDPEKAQQYSLLRAEAVSASPTEYQSVNNW
jgi:hypothetical protein